MAGHSKWANIQHRKGAQDKKRAKIFTKLIREISVAAKAGGGDPDSNPRLRLALDKAFTANLSKDTAERAIKRATGEGATEDFEHVRYEGYGPGGVAVMVDCLTDNRNRTVSEVRYAFTKNGGNLGTDGSVAYLFTRTGVVSYPQGSDENAIMGAALEAGADDVVNNEDGSIDVLIDPDRFAEVRGALFGKGLTSDYAEVTMRPATYVSLDKEQAETMVKLLEMLEDLDDVQNVYSNADIAEDILAGMA
jgi:YebC/PmpR family DNA-binding regulatory protein